MKLLAEKYHKGQFRKGKEKLPYIVHPKSVAETLILWGEDPGSRTVLMAWGHDLLEDTAVSEREIIAAADEELLKSIKLLTRPEYTEKKLYLKNIVRNGGRDELLVKMSDRICNTGDFISLKGRFYAFQYLHEADCLLPALQKFRGDRTVDNALQAWQKMDDSLRSEARHKAIRGCLIGGAVGDAMGAPLEFLSRKEIRKKYGPWGAEGYVEFPDGTGAVTDDTQMTLFTAEGLLRAQTRSVGKGVCDPAEIMRYAYQRWYVTQGQTSDAPPECINSGWLIREKALHAVRAPGMSCLSALAENRPRAANNSKGCGTVMRMAPVGLFLEPEEAYKYGCEFSAITHGHHTGITAGGAFAMLISFLCGGKNLTEALDLTQAHLLCFSEAAETFEAIQKARSAQCITDLGEGWVAEEALAMGIYCALHCTWDFRNGILEAVNITGDSDSAGAVAGNILGVLNGEEGIPEEWRRNLREYAIVSQCADDLHRRCDAGEYDQISDAWWEKYPGF